MTEVQSFAGFVSFRWFIQDFSHVAKPYTSSQERRGWRWTKAEQEASRELKWRHTSTPILVS